MSTEMPVGLLVAEKIVGLVLLILGGFFAYASLTPPAGDVSHFGSIFVILGVAVAVAGIFLIIPKGK
jgi:hypothetical protein